MKSILFGQRIHFARPKKTDAFTIANSNNRNNKSFVYLFAINVWHQCLSHWNVNGNLIQFLFMLFFCATFANNRCHWICRIVITIRFSLWIVYSNCCTKENNDRCDENETLDKYPLSVLWTFLYFIITNAKRNKWKYKNKRMSQSKINNAEI